MTLRAELMQDSMIGTDRRLNCRSAKRFARDNGDGDA
jgi:hypothetical protein